MGMDRQRHSFLARMTAEDVVAASRRAWRGRPVRVPGGSTSGSCGCRLIRDPAARAGHAVRTEGEADGMIDIHSHVFWGLDDGAASLEDSLAMARDAASTGTTDMVATPHLNARFEYRPELVTERMAELARGWEDWEAGPGSTRGCEFHVNFDNIDHLLGTALHLHHQRRPYLLLECPDLHLGKHMERIFERLFEARITPIIAHPERNPLLRQKPEKLEEWKRLWAAPSTGSRCVAHRQCPAKI